MEWEGNYSCRQHRFYKVKDIVAAHTRKPMEIFRCRRCRMAYTGSAVRNMVVRGRGILGQSEPRMG